MGLGPIHDDVRFDHGAAERLITLASSAADRIEGQRGSRRSWALTAMREFRGRFSRLFDDNALTGDADAAELVASLGDVARFTRDLATAARQEQERREAARRWQQEQESQNVLEQGWGWTKNHLLGQGEETPPVPDMPAEPSFEPTAVAARTRQTPAPGAGGGAGGTSSARPEDLRSFATGSRGLNSGLSGLRASCTSAYGDFVAGCGWGRLEASGTFRGLGLWLEANEEDVRWATTVADAFARAGGEGAVSTLSNSALAATLHAAGVDASRQDLVIDPPTAYGNPPTSGYADDPVNAATGNFIENETDLGFAGGNAGLALTRTYNSFDSPGGTDASAGAGAFGPGWSSWTETVLDLTDDSARMRLADGRVVVFPRLGDAWDRARGESLWVERVSDGTATDAYLVRDNAGARWHFGRDGRLREHSRGPGTAVRLVHEDVAGTPRLVRMEHARGRAITLEWDATPGAARVVAAAASDGRQVTYAYDDGGRLVAVTTPLGTRRYRWEDGLLAAVIDADGVVEAENVYDDRARVVRQRSQHGRASRFVYLPGNVTVVSDEDGTRSNTWISDQRGRVVGIVDADERRQSTSYDSRGNAVSVTERDGATTVHEYDERGRRVRTVTPAGADLTFGYDEHDRVTTVVTEVGAVTEYSYADAAGPGTDRDPSVMVDPEGGRTRYSWTAGLLTEIEDPTGVTVRLGYDDHGDLVSTTDALGHVARLERDSTGRVRAAITPSGARTAYAYAPSGLLASRRDADGAVWRYEHTAAGRLAAVVDPTGARTEVERGEHGEETRTIDPLGRSVTRTLDDLGNVASAELPDGSTWRFAHDALSRLVTTTDPLGGEWTTEHDTTGAVSATVDPTGVRRSVTSVRATGSVTVDDGVAAISTRYDALGRAVSAEQADGSAAMATYDRCGRPVELLDAEGGLTRIDRDAAGRPVAITSPSGAVTRREYDVCGRLVAVVDPTGARTTQEYDADGRVVRQVLPTGEVAWTEHDAVGRVTARYRPGSGVARYAYDSAGRVTQSSDTWHGRRRYRYDAAGQLVEVVNGNGGVTRWDYDANGRAVAVTDPLGQVTRREFDAMNHCVAETDPLGRTTRAGYDAAGRQVWQTDPDGRRTEWTFDSQGRLASTAVDGRVVSSITRDVRARRVTLTDRTRDDDAVVTHELEWNRRGQLVSRRRDGRGVSWTYDADGRRATMTTPDGSTTSYERDASGRVTAVDHPLLGRAVLEHDATGRVVTATAGGTIQTWEHADGFVVGHTITDTTGSSRTVVRRDADGRISAVARDGDTTTYDYDEACQLVGLHADTAHATADVRWRYDAAGRLVSESIDGADGEAVRELVYDAAGQLVTATGYDGSLTRYSYDGAGRRTAEEWSDGSRWELSWSATGWLSAITEHSTGGKTRRTDVHVDACGELARVDGTETFFDAADPYAPALVQAGDTPVIAAGPVTGVGAGNGDTVTGGWSAAGWRTARTSEADPWNPGATGTGGIALPGGLSLGSAGELSLPGGMEWLGARVYDPTTRGFLSVDPLDPVPGTGWSGNPYSYAGNDPVHATDPTGLRPLTDADLQAYQDSHQGWMNDVGDWAADNWEYVAAGAMVIGGAALMFAPIPGAQLVGAGLISAGIDTAIQKATTGEVNWGQVAVSGAAGAIGFGAGGMVARAGMTMGRAVAVGAVGGAAEGMVGGAGNYLIGPGPHTPGGMLEATARSGVTGAAFGAGGGALGHVAAPFGRQLDEIAPNPNILSGHGGIAAGDAATVAIPEGTSLRFYSRHGDSLSDIVGNQIERGAPPPPVEIARAGTSVPDYILARPDGLNIVGNPTTVSENTRLSQLLRPHMGDVDWAACRNVV